MRYPTSCDQVNPSTVLIWQLNVPGALPPPLTSISFSSHYSQLTGFSGDAGSTIIQPETERVGGNFICAVPFIPLCPSSNQCQVRMAKCYIYLTCQMPEPFIHAAIQSGWAFIATTTSGMLEPPVHVY